MKILKIRLKSNEEIPCLINHNIPLFLPLNYIILSGIKNKSYTTKYKFIKSYSLFDDYLSKNYNTNIQKIILKKNTELFLKNKYLYNFILWLPTKVKSRFNINIYLNSLKLFLLWVHTFYYRTSNVTENIILIKNLINSNIIKNYQVNEYKSITKESIGLILEKINPNNKENPFKDNKIRNYLIFVLLVETGIRKSELLKLKSEDFIRNSDQFYIKIVSRVSDLEETRINKPYLKNQYSQRVLAISKTTYQIFEDYILFFRNNNHSFVFTSNRGTPLSKSGINKIFIIIKKHTNIDLTIHTLRHYFTESMLEYLLEVKNINMERSKDELKKLCGWSLNSNMPTYYTAKYIQRISNKHNLERLRDDE